MSFKVAEPMGDPQMAPFFVRIGLGGYFFLAGLMKLSQQHSFIAHVKAFDILPDQAAIMYGIALPYAEIVVGIMLTTGFLTSLAGVLGGILLASYVIALGVFPYSARLFNKDIILLGAAVSLIFSGSGAFSIDRFRKG